MERPLVDKEDWPRSSGAFQKDPATPKELPTAPRFGRKSYESRSPATAYKAGWCPTCSELGEAVGAENDSTRPATRVGHSRVAILSVE